MRDNNVLPVLKTTNVEVGESGLFTSDALLFRSGYIDPSDNHSGRYMSLYPQNCYFYGRCHATIIHLFSRRP